MLNRIKAFVKNDDGPTVTEYAVMLALIVIVSVGAIQLIGYKVADVYDTIQNAL